MTKLSVEARIIAGTLWTGYMSHTELSFRRPHIIHPKTRKGLDELVEAGLLTMEKPDDHLDTLSWKPTPLMVTDGPKRPSEAFMKRHTFPLTTE